MPTTPTELPLDLVQDLQLARANLATAKHIEMALRQQVVDLINHKAKGATTVEVGGFKVTATRKVKVKLDAVAMEACVGDNPWWLNDLISYVPKLSVGAYNKLTPTELETINPCITTSPASPDVKITAIEPQE